MLRVGQGRSAASAPAGRWLFEAIHDGIVAFFVCELLGRLRAGGWRFLRRPINAFDAAVILVSAMPALGVDASLLRLARAARLVHFAKHAGHLRAVAWLGGRLAPVRAQT
jgi:hypothetical protein